MKILMITGDKRIGAATSERILTNNGTIRSQGGDGGNGGEPAGT